jgi:DNA-binding transcriptional regulator LsrR (DeoR family)
MPGVSIFATGAEKAEIVRACIDRGLCNTLIGSHELIEEIVKSAKDR